MILFSQIHGLTLNTPKSLENIMLETKGSTLHDSVYTVCLEDLWRHNTDLWLPRAGCGFGGHQWHYLAA